MEDNDKIYDQFRDAAEKAEHKAYPDMDKVWNRVESKLDNTMLTKENHLWKKIAIAASVILTVTLVFQFLTPGSEPIVKSKNAIVVHEDSEIMVQPRPTDSAPIENPVIKPEAATILERQIEQADEQVVDVTANKERVSTAVALDSANDHYQSAKRIANSKGSFPTSRKLEAVSVRQDANFDAEMAAPAAQVVTKDPPLLIVDGKAITDTGSRQYKKALKEALAGAASGDDAATFVMKEPLYIINSVPYSEAELFGPNPTSPYSPLNKQEIESIAILQIEQATAIYGERGKNGVVIITIKNKKPLDAGRK